MFSAHRVECLRPSLIKIMQYCSYHSTCPLEGKTVGVITGNVGVLVFQLHPAAIVLRYTQQSVLGVSQLDGLLSLNHRTTAVA